MNEEFFNTLRQTITDTAEAVSKRTEELVEIQRIKTRTISIQRGIDKNYKMLGELVYQRFAAGESMDEEVTEICDLILEQHGELRALKEELASKRSLNCCPNCGSRNPAAAAFCMSCGTKLPVAEMHHAQEEDMEEEEMRFEDEEEEKETAADTAESETSDAEGEVADSEDEPDCGCAEEQPEADADGKEETCEACAEDVEEEK